MIKIIITLKIIWMIIPSLFIAWRGPKATQSHQYTNVLMFKQVFGTMLAGHLYILEFIQI